MKKFTILIAAICMFSCSKEDNIVETHGTKLISIDYKDEFDSWSENYFYSSNNELASIENSFALGRRYEIDYINNKVNEIATYRMDSNTLIFRDSILYNDDGTIQAIHNFSINSGENVPLAWIYEFEYDNEAKVTRKSTFFVETGEYTTIEKYYWKGDNIERVEYCNGDEELYYEFFYEYDNKKNYQKEVSIDISDPINWSNNNVTKMSANDYVGNLDLISNPAINEYIYNLDNYPVSVKTNWGRQWTLNYE